MRRLVAGSQGDAAHDGDAVRPQDGLHQVLVHADGRGRDPGADVGDVGELEQPLHRAVLAERSVEDRQHDLDAGQRPHDR